MTLISKSLPYEKPVCRGSLGLGTGCGRCERCSEERRRIQAAQSAEKADTFEAPSPAIDASKIFVSGAVSLKDWQNSAGGTTIEGGKVAGLPVAGYKQTQPQWAIDLVNANKVLEEKILRQIDQHFLMAGDLDQRCVAQARTQIQDGFMWLNRAVFQPQRLEGDLE